MLATKKCNKRTNSQEVCDLTHIYKSVIKITILEIFVKHDKSLINIDEAEGPSSPKFISVTNINKLRDQKTFEEADEESPNRLKPNFQRTNRRNVTGIKTVNVEEEVISQYYNQRSLGARSSVDKDDDDDNNNIKVRF